MRQQHDDVFTLLLIVFYLRIARVKPMRLRTRADGRNQMMKSMQQATELGTEMRRHHIEQGSSGKHRLRLVRVIWLRLRFTGTAPY